MDHSHRTFFKMQYTAMELRLKQCREAFLKVVYKNAMSAAQKDVSIAHIYIKNNEKLME